MITRNLSILLFLIVPIVNCEEPKILSLMASRSEVANTNEFPYFASLKVDGEHICGGSLISRLHVLTAAHCVHSVLEDYPDNFDRHCTVELGSVVSGAGTIHAVRRLAIHKGFIRESDASKINLPNDIAIVTLKKPVQLSPSIQIIALPKSMGFFSADAKPVVAGFGSYEIDGEVSKVLRKAVSTPIYDVECNAFFNKFYHKDIWDNQLCIKYKFGYGSCQGDSGGPLVYNNQVVGIISWGSARCGTDDPEVLTKVSSYLEFIDYEVKKDYQSQLNLIL